ncbi:MAG TPA: hypothetical protein VIC57_17430 [Candidatus Dormibacteraeota bacterium]|jgi:hypothetical protein
MAPVPVWAKLVAVLVATATVPWTILMVLAGAVALTWTNAATDRTTTFAVGAAPRLHIEGTMGQVIIEAGQDGRVVVQDRQSANAMTRGLAVWVLRRTAVQTDRAGDTIRIDQMNSDFQSLGFSGEPVVTVRVPVHTDLEIRDASVLVQGIDGTVTYEGDQLVQLRNVILRGASTITTTTAPLELSNVTIAGATKVSGGLGTIHFDGSLAPGGSSLDIRSHNFVTIALPKPTDAHAVVTGALSADPVWGFVTGPSDPRERWTADLGPDPKGTVTVESDGGLIEFDVKVAP